MISSGPLIPTFAKCLLRRDANVGIGGLVTALLPFFRGAEVLTRLQFRRDERSRVRIPEQRYAVFSHREHISTIRRTISTIWNHWLPASGHKLADAPSFERYDEKFDSVTGDGGLEIWVPII
jgi:AraC family transcriptional regulator